MSDTTQRGPHLLTAVSGEQEYCGGPGACEFCERDARAARGRAVVDIEFHFAPGVPYVICGECGALVRNGDHTKHAQWHAKLYMAVMETGIL